MRRPRNRRELIRGVKEILVLNAKIYGHVSYLIRKENPQGSKEISAAVRLLDRLIKKL